MTDITISKNEKSEEVQDIIDRMPTKFGNLVVGLLFIIVLVLLTFGWYIKYPDIVTGSIIINAKYPPIKLVSNSAGKLTLFVSGSKEQVTEGQYMAIIQNPANIADVKRIKTLLTKYEINNDELIRAYPLFPSKAALGDINVKYYTFLTALAQLYNYKINNIYEKQEAGLRQQIDGLQSLLDNNRKLKDTRQSNMTVAKKISDRDSLLLAEKSVAEDDADHSRINYLTSKEGYQAIKGEINKTTQEIDDDKSKLAQLLVEKSDKEKEMSLNLISSYDELRDNINEWEQHFVFKAPMSGMVEFTKFWSNNQYIPSQENVFTIVPAKNEIVGQVQLPAKGAGKVKIGQKVIIKLNNYPYEEYGLVYGKVNSISLTTNEVKVTNDNNIDTYLVEVGLPDALTTNYGSKLEFKYEIKGTADIISKDRRLIERFFDNLKYGLDRN